jgi:farnesyl diphosphate synthase
MRYATIGGKRVRPLLVAAVAEMYGVDRDAAVRVGAAIESVHVYSLIHDDLPCMDDDALRHGKPTLHIAFDEATAVLAGDALQCFAFELLADTATSGDPFVRVELVTTLATASGHNGMAGGQMMDIAAETSSFDLATVTRLQQLKTGPCCALRSNWARFGQGGAGRAPSSARLCPRYWSGVPDRR